MKFSKKIIFAILFSLIVIAGLAYHFFGKALWQPNFKTQGNTGYIFIPSNATIDEVAKILKDSSFIIDESSFRNAASLMSYGKNKIPGGKYKVENNWTNRTLISNLRSGNQAPQRIVINNIRLMSDLAGKASKYFESDSLAFMAYLTDTLNSKKFGYAPETFLTMFIPNTYEMFWTTTPEKFTERMQNEYERFWSKENEAKLLKNNLSKTQAYIVASIVEKESNYDPEKPTIAGVYLNRLKVGEKLQADPTVVFATGDFSIQRVLYSHLTLDSPYNTYKNVGLPPGPICMPSLSSLEAVINAEVHDYMFFCAKADNSGVHAFAKDYNEHLKNAKAFADWMNSLNIK